MTNVSAPVVKVDAFAMAIQGILSLELEPNEVLKRDRKGIVKSKARVRKNAEVFTQPREVFDMIALVEESADESMPLYSRTYLEPACGDGNFLTEILKRKLFHAYEVADGDLDKWLRLSLVCFSTLYGLDIMADNIAKSHHRLREVFVIMSSLFANLDCDQIEQLKRVYFDSKLDYQAFIDGFPDDVSFAYRKNLFNAMSYDWKDFSDLELVGGEDLRASAAGTEKFIDTIQGILQANIKEQSFLKSCEKKGYVAKCPDDLFFLSYEWPSDWLDNGTGRPEPSISKCFIESGESYPVGLEEGIGNGLPH